MAVQLDQSQTGHDSYAGLLQWIQGNRWVGQTFQAGISGDLVEVKLWLIKTGSPPNPLTIEIRNVSGGFPGSSILATTTILASNITSLALGAEASAVFSTPASISFGTDYAIVFHMTGGDFSNCYDEYDQSTGGYANGAGCRSFDGGSSWSFASPRDLYFKTYVDAPITIQETILSDAKIKVFDNQKTIPSDAQITNIVQKTITSDAIIKSIEQKTILSDAKLVDRFQKTILSDAHIKVVGDQKTITSDANIAVVYFYNIINKFNSVKRILSNINHKFNSAIRVLSDCTSMFNMVKGKIYNILNDFRSKKRVLNNCNNDIRFLKPWQIPGSAGFQSLGKSYIRVYINSIEQTDVNVDSINIYKIINGAHTANFNLGRAYDASKPLIESEVEIKYHTWTLYKGYIISITPSDNPESISIGCQDKYWQQNKTNKYFHVGHEPTDNQELYYSTIQSAIVTELGWAIDIGNFVPQTIDCFTVGQSDCLTTLIEQCGNYGWYYDVNGNKILTTAEVGSIININKQFIGKNLKLYDLINHRFSEDITNIINKFRVQMGDKVIRKFNDTGGSRTYTGYNYSNFQTHLIPAWNCVYERLAKDSSSGYGWDYHKPEDDELYNDVFKKYNIPYLDSELSSWSDRYPLRLVMADSSWMGIPISPFGNKNITEGYTIDYENKTITFSEPQFLYRKNSYGELTSVRAPNLILAFWKKNYYTYTTDPLDNPETDITNPLMFFVGSGTPMKDLDLSNLGIQEGYTFVDEEGETQVIPSWNDTEFATDIANWELSKVNYKKIIGDIDLTLDNICFYNIDLSKRIYIEGITESAMNINSISYNLNNFIVTIELQKQKSYKRTISFQSHGE